MVVYNNFVNFNSVLVSKVMQSSFLGDDFSFCVSFSSVHQEFPAKPDLPTTRDGFCRPPKIRIHVSDVKF